MSYTADTPILSAGTVSAAAIRGWFEARGPSYAPGYAPDGQYLAPPAELGRAIVDECRRYPQAVVNHDLVAGQVLIETAAWQSRYARERNNPGGIGAINADPDQALWFASVADGLRAHVAHLLVYAVGDGPWSADDPRRDAVAARGWLGSAPTLRGLNGRWAYPGTTYGQNIATQANALVAFAAGYEEEPPPVPFTIHRAFLPDGASNKPNRPMTPRYVTIHETANTASGATAAMHAQWLQNLAKQGAGEPSWHYTVDEREAYQHLRLDEMGWHAGDGANGTGNRESIGIELCVNQGADFGRTLANAAGLVRDLMQRYGIPRERVVQHRHWSGKLCPATIIRTAGLWESFLDALDDPAPAPPARDPMADIVVDPWGRANPWGTFYTPRVFAADMIANGLAATGHLVSGMFIDTDGKHAQYAERCRLEWNPDPKHPAGGYVTREHLGLLVLAERHPDRDPRRAA